MPGLDGARTFEQLSDRPSNAATDEIRKRQSEYCSNGCDDDRNQDQAPLIPHNHRGTGNDLSQHVGARRINLLIEFISKGISTPESASGLNKVSRLKLGGELYGFFIQMPTEIVYSAIYPVIDARQRHVV